MKRLNFTLPAVVFGVTFLAGHAYGQLSVVWERQFNGPAGGAGESVSAGADGIYICGETLSSPYPGQVVGTAFVSKYDFGGNVLWTKELFPGNTNNNDGNWFVSAASDGAYVAGVFPGSGVLTLRKYDPNGNVLWTDQIPAGLVLNSPSVSAAADGVYVSGETGVQAFVSKYDRNGNELWTRVFGFYSGDATGVGAAPDGVYVIGSTAFELTGGFTFLTKYDPSGNELWTQQFPQSISLTSVSATASGVYVGGTAALPERAFLSGYDTSGNQRWTSALSSVYDPIVYQPSVAGVSATADSVFVAWGSFFFPAPVSEYGATGNVIATSLPGLVAPSIEFGIRSPVSAGAGVVYVTGFCTNAAQGANGCVAMLLAGAQNSPPVSSVSALPANESSPNFLVQWSSANPGFTKNYTIYVSDTGGAFVPWQTTTAATQAWYSGLLGHTYGFFSQADSWAGTVENLKTVADATTQTPAASPADVNGDGQINCADAALVKASFGKRTGQPGFNSAADVNKDGVVNVLDLALVTQKLIPGTVCQ